ncbi:MAG: ATP-grasp domain-containing protein [Polynucleobacter sp.]|nr:ATP-grasp domain-containing protein [Polynucleobacter sp.]MDZ4055649.1 ATP-grasp domain-containing protein [Polynucleobacter sp.]
MKKILILFAKDWDQLALQAQQYSGQYQFFYEGFDLFRFPENAKLMGFNALRYISKLERKYRAIGLDGVVSNHEQFGALIAAVLAQRLGLPGNDPLAIIACQHKYYGRLVQQKIAPEAVPRFSYIPYPFNPQSPLEIPYPFFIKPIKATYSVLAKQIDNQEALVQHLKFNLLEEFLIRKLVKPFADLMPLFTPMQANPNGLLAEEIMRGEQMNIDGYCLAGKVFFLGVIDEIMYPETQAFMRFEYPSRLSHAVQDRAKAIAKKVLEGLNYHHGFFNIEFIYEPETDRLKIIEINPRMASQLSNLYERVDGCRPYAMLFALAVGDEPEHIEGQGQFKSAASFIFRRFHRPASQSVPSQRDLADALAPYPDANMMLYYKKGASLDREIKWLGSYRYAVLNLGGLSRSDLFDHFQNICKKLYQDDAICRQHK